MNDRRHLTDESEAMNLWCPFSRQLTYEGETSFNRCQADTILGMLPEGCTCIGSHCMAWLFDKKTDGEQGYCGLTHGRLKI